MQSAFDYYAKNNISVTWTLICIGLDFLDYTYRIKVSEIKEYAMSLLNSGSSKDELIELLWIDDNSEGSIASIIDKLKSKESVDFDVERRKWVLYVLNSAISNISMNANLFQLLELDDLYLYLGCPEHFPQDMHNEDYAHCTNLNEMIIKHKVWIKNEISELQKQ